MRLLATILLLATLATSAQAGAEGTILKPKLTLAAPQSVDQDDMCLWHHPTDPALNTVITSDKAAGILFVYDMDGNAIQAVEKVGKPGNIDLRDGFSLGGKKVSIVAFNERDGFKVHLYAVDPDTRKIARVDDKNIKTGLNYGLTLYHSATTGDFHAITVPDDDGGDVEQYRLSENAEGTISGEKVRSWPIGQSEGCAADDTTGTLYIGEEGAGIWRVGAEPEDATPGTLVQSVGEHGLTADVEGLTLLKGAGENQYLLASSQGSSSYNVYRLDDACTFVKTFTVEGATDTDGIDVSPKSFGPDFPGGIFTLHNGAKAPYPVLVCDLRDLGLPLE